MHIFKKKFGRRLKELRKAKNISQETFAELIEITPRNLSRIETGQIFPSAVTLEKIILKLDCNACELFNFEHLDSENNLKEKILLKIDKLSTEKLIMVYKFLSAIE